MTEPESVDDVLAWMENPDVPLPYGWDLLASRLRAALERERADDDALRDRMYR